MNNEGYIALGMTRDKDTCECCGKTGLVKTVMLQWVDADGNPEGDIEHFGTTCASHAVSRRLGVKVTAKAIREEAERNDRQKDQDERNRLAAWKQAEIDNARRNVDLLIDGKFSRAGDELWIGECTIQAPKPGFPDRVFLTVRPDAFKNRPDLKIIEKYRLIQPGRKKYERTFPE